MVPWARILVAFAVIVVAALFLKLLPAVLVLAVLIGGVWYVNHRLRTEERASRPSGEQILGLRREAEDRFGLLALPLQLFSRSGEAAVDEVVWGPWRGLEVRVFALSFRAPSLGTTGPRRVRFAVALTNLDAELPTLVLEPQAFLTRLERPPGLAPVALGDLDHAWNGWSSDPQRALGFVLDERVRSWLGTLDEGWGIEVGGRIAMVYRPSEVALDPIAEIEVLRELVERVPGDLAVPGGDPQV